MNKEKVFGKFKNFNLNILMLSSCIDLLEFAFDSEDDFEILLALDNFKRCIDSFIDDFEVTYDK